MQTRRHVLARVADRFKRQYEEYFGTDFRFADGGVPVETWRKLVNLGPEPSVADVDAITGNNSWTNNECDECGLDAESVVVFGDDDQDADCETHMRAICPKCLAAAMKLAKSGDA